TRTHLAAEVERLALPPFNAYLIQGLLPYRVTSGLLTGRSEITLERSQLEVDNRVVLSRLGLVKGGEPDPIERDIGVPLTLALARRPDRARPGLASRARLCRARRDGAGRPRLHRGRAGALRARRRSSSRAAARVPARAARGTAAAAARRARSGPARGGPEARAGSRKRAPRPGRRPRSSRVGQPHRRSAGRARARLCRSDATGR